ncbi:antibiotic biosynthesis monooxygenase family protein [Actinocorallia sp. A-T 12471]|uniref:putative quinol monooxygenase n=1 Tax=Actinocorallia sp. A-T 12471 TaxID=3089813 RepID=UPI0029CC716A|nr:antibiotic biosynthesis monooxygenase family protein [Actinocorallia sp. A-T 12471]MDX6744165.1 antibiotic biosynthesis monooxygenase family protein [Actinocorallia sp. A-T 12471]
MPYAVIAHYRCAESDAPTVQAALTAMQTHTPTEPGNLAYIVHTDTETPPGESSFTLYEQYADEPAFTAHTQTPHFHTHILQTIRPLLTSRTIWTGQTL